MLLFWSCHFVRLFSFDVDLSGMWVFCRNTKHTWFLLQGCQIIHYQGFHRESNGCCIIMFTHCFRPWFWHLVPLLEHILLFTMQDCVIYSNCIIGIVYHSLCCYAVLLNISSSLTCWQVWCYVSCFRLCSVFCNEFNLGPHQQVSGLWQ